MLRPDQIQHILKLYKVYLRKGYTVEDACIELGQLYGKSPATIRNLVYRLTADTTGVSTSFIKANALKMTMRVVRDASVQQVMDILERPNIGVLAPKKAGAEGGSRGFFLTVSADSCGAVKASVGMIEGGAPDQPEQGDADDDLLFQDAQASLAPGLPASPGEGLPGFSYIDLIPEEEKDSLGRHNFSKTPEGRAELAKPRHPMGPGHSKSYLEAVERAKKKLEAAKV